MVYYCFSLFLLERKSLHVQADAEDRPMIQKKHTGTSNTSAMNHITQMHTFLCQT